MNTLSSSVPESLSHLREQLDHHRAIGKRAVFPDELKRRVITLSKDFPASTLLHTLAISSSSLDRWKKQYLPRDTNTTRDTDNPVTNTGKAFVALPATDTSDRYPLTVSLGSADSDVQITLQGEITLSHWHELLVRCSEALLP